jgi:CHAD domain-containing protein
MNVQILSAHSDVHSTIGSYACKMIQHELAQVAKQEEAVLEDSDVEPLHKMRVGMRRLRAAFNIFSPAIALPAQATIQVIAKVSKQLGSTRDWDVMKDALKNDYGPLLSGTEQERLNETLQHLKKLRKRSFVLPDLLMPMTGQLLLHPGWWVVPPEFSSVRIPKTRNIEQGPENEVLHSLRKQVKEIRYQSEFFKSFYPLVYTDYIEDLKSIQELLGQLQDCSVLSEFLTAELMTPVDKVLPTVAQRFQQTKDQAWQNWQPLRQRFTDAGFRQKLRSQILCPCYPSPEAA